MTSDQRKLVLVVDADQRFIDAARALLTHHRALAARDLEEAREIVLGGRVDVVLLGAAFATESAVAAAAGLHAADPTVQLVLAADVVTNRLLKAALRGGFADVVDLPLTPAAMSLIVGDPVPSTHASELEFVVESDPVPQAATAPAAVPGSTLDQLPVAPAAVAPIAPGADIPAAVVQHQVPAPDPRFFPPVAPSPASAVPIPAPVTVEPPAPAQTPYEAPTPAAPVYAPVAPAPAPQVPPASVPSAIEPPVPVTMPHVPPVAIADGTPQHPVGAPTPPPAVSMPVAATPQPSQSRSVLDAAGEVRMESPVAPHAAPPPPPAAPVQSPAMPSPPSQAPPTWPGTPTASPFEPPPPPPRPIAPVPPVEQPGSRPDVRRDPRQRPTGPGHVIAVMAGKGGSGKSVVATNLAIAMGLRHDPERVAIVDADLQFGDVALMLQLDPVRTIDDVVGQLDSMTDSRLDSALLRHESGVRVLPAPLLPVRAGEIPAKSVVEVVDRLRGLYDTIIVDTGPVFDDGLVLLLEHADSVVTVVDMDLPSVKNAKVALDALRGGGFPMERITLVVNRVNSKARLDLVELERSLGLRVGGSVPSDRLVPQSVNEGIPLLALSPRSKVARSFMALAERLDPHAGRERLNGAGR